MAVLQRLVAFGMIYLAHTMANDHNCSQTLPGLPEDNSDDDLSAMLQVGSNLAGSLNADKRNDWHPLAPHKKTDGSQYYWSMRAGDTNSSSSVKYAAPTKLSKGPSTTWSNPLDELMRHTPLIDDNNNIYVMFTARIRKFDPEANVLWTFEVPEEEGVMSSSPSLYDGAIYAFAHRSIGKPMYSVYSIDMETGSLIWKKRYARKKAGDSACTLAYNNTFFVPTQHASVGSDALLALNTSDGSMLWEYKTDHVMWNFKPSTPGDGSIIFSSACGGVHRIDWDGNLLWKKDDASESENGMCSMGGGAVGPNGIFYTVHGLKTSGEAPGKGQRKAFVNAYRIHDGEPVWSRTFDQYGAQYPAVGHLGADGPLVVVAGLGDELDPTGRKLPEGEELFNAVVTMDAETGDVLWRFDEKGWPWSSAAGDFGLIQAKRVKEVANDKRRDVICWPDPQGIPVISGDGYVYASSSHNGDLYALKDKDHNGQVTAGEVSTFETGVGFLNSPSIAPGMVVASPCWGPMYIFKD